MHTITAGSARWPALAAALLLALTGCSGGNGRASARGTEPAPSTTPTTVASTTTTTAARLTTTTGGPPAPPEPGLGVGAKGDAVAALQQRLTDLHYDTGAVNGVFGSSTAFAVMAFQKVEGLKRTGRATPDVLDRLATATVPAPLVPGGGARRVEVDLPRQVLFLYEGDVLFRIVPVSTGSGQRYCVDGQCDRAVTPGGSFRVTWRVSGWHTSRLGRLYNPLFFNGGIAIHGALSVPAYPASHGCVRVPMYVAGCLPGHLPGGTPVYVVGGPVAPVPFNEPAPNEAPASTTSTTSSTPTTQPGATSTTPTTEPATTTTTTAAPAAPTTTVPVP